MMAENDGRPIVEVDIATRVLGDAEDIYVIRPGKGSWLYRDFEQNHAVFLDFPFLDIDLATRPSANELKLKIVRSIAIGDWMGGRKRGTPPSRTLSDYKGKTARRRLGRYVGAVQSLYYDIPDRAIVVVPGPGYLTDVLVGEITGPATSSTKILPYDGEPVPIRPVNWLGRRQKASFKKAILDRLATPNPVMILDRSLREDILRVGYDQFSINGRYAARFRTEASDYSSLDDEDITSFANYVAGLIAADEETEADAGTITAKKALITLRQYRDRVPELSTNINSPGYLRLLSERVDPLTIAVLMAFALTGADAANGADIRVKNSAGPKSDPCAFTVSEQAKGAMSMMTFDDFSEKCRAFTQAAHNVGLQSTMKAKVKKPSK